MTKGQFGETNSISRYWHKSIESENFKMSLTQT